MTSRSRAFLTSWILLGLPAGACLFAAGAAEPNCLSPTHLAATRDGRQILVACGTEPAVRVFDTIESRKGQTIVWCIFDVDSFSSAL